MYEMLGAFLKMTIPLGLLSMVTLQLFSFFFKSYEVHATYVPQPLLLMQMCMSPLPI